MNLRDKILLAKDIESELVEIPQWDVIIEVKGLNGKQRSLLLQDTMGDAGKLDLVKLYPQLVVRSCFDPDTGERIFTDADCDAIAEKSGAVQEIIGAVAMRLSGLDGKTAEKNSDATPKGDSIST
jgi:hypothetical protein